MRFALRLNPRWSCIALGGLLLAAAGSSCPQLDLAASGLSDIGGTSEYVGASICQRCHTEVHALWADSPHAKALDTLRDRGSDADRSCLPCHTTGFGQRGFVSAAATPGLAGVQCESCHGPGATHVGTRDPADIVRDPGTDVCGNCHTGPQQPNHEEWLASGHAQALSAVLAAPDASDSCLVCHSYDYALAVRRNGARLLSGLAPLPLPSILDEDSSNDPQEGVGCSACHHPHGSKFPSELRAGISATCATCHSDPQLASGQSPHSPQLNLLQSTDGRALDQSTGGVAVISDPPSVHGSIESLGGCAKCHGQKAYQDMATSESPNQTGHRFEIAYENCTPCHSAEDGAALTANLANEVQNRLAELRSRLAGIDQSALSREHRTLLSSAALNLDYIEADESNGAHNGRFVRRLMDASEQLIDAVSPQSP